MRPDFQGMETGLATQALRQLKLDGQIRVHAEFGVGDLCVRCREAVDDLEHIGHHCPAWNVERREVGMLASALDTPTCIKLEGLVCTLRGLIVLVVAVATLTSFWHCVGLPLPVLKQFVYRAELLATVGALEECQPGRLVSDCKGVVAFLHALRAGRKHPKGPW
eukprot:6466234-Amphidinium_carterae.3